MTNEAAAARRAYKREWARNNPEKIRAQQERYWAKKAEQVNAERADQSGSGTTSPESKPAQDD